MLLKGIFKKFKHLLYLKNSLTELHNESEKALSAS